ncbi:MAG TPA: hypothetical protein VGX97_00400 [bacterium]|nr:hypothetical protein [bacterium]
MLRRSATATAAALVLALALPTWAGHEAPFDPSYYPHEIQIESMAPAAAGPLLGRASIQAFVGGNPYNGRKVPPDVTPVESLDAYVVLTVDTARLKDRGARCAAAQRTAGALAAKHPAFVVAPYPVTPFHPDYLGHADLAAAARERASASAGGSGSGSSDVRVETVPVRDLLAAHATRFAGWVGPPWLKDGWYDAYLLLAGSVSDPADRSAIDRLYGRLISGEPRSETESLNLERTLVSLLRRGCERVVVGYTTSREYYSSAYSPGIENVGFDSYDGADSDIFVRTAKLKDFPWNGVLRLGVAAQPTAPWNPVAGFGDPFGRLVWAAVGDPAMLPSPYGGGWIANRIGSWETWSVKFQRAFGGVAVPDTSKREIDVPADAVLPRPRSGALDRVGPGKRAADMVEYRVLASAFHDGTIMTPADALYPFAFAARWGTPSLPGGAAGRASRTYDPAVDRATALARRYLAGVKVIRVQKVVRDLGADLKIRYDVPIVQVYLAYAGADQNTALVAMPWSTVPWHVLALVDAAARRGIGALSAEGAAALGIPALDLVRSPAQAVRLARLVDEFASDGYVPEALRDAVTPAEARARWRALAAFYREYRHFLVTNGPYRLVRWSKTTAVLGVFRDLSYPLGVGSFDKEVYPRRAFIKTIAVRGGRIEFRPVVERLFKYDRYYKLVTEDLGSNTSGAYDDINAVCRYVVVRADGHVVRTGSVTAPKNGTFSFNPADGLDRGAYTIRLAVSVNGNLMNPDVKTVAYRR